MKQWIRHIGLCAAIVGSALSTGCALLLVGAAIGAGTVAYVSGELRAADEVTMDRAWSATLGAMSELQFKVTTQQKDALAGQIVARRADDTKIEIRLKRQSDRVTEFRIRVGTFGDEALSRYILDKIKARF